MPIAFEGVSYSYADPARQEKRKSRAKRRREAGVIEDAPSLERGKPAWGGDPDAVWALRDITFELEDGEFLGIAGHTGSGKSTLIQHMNGLVSPTRGRVLLDGQDLADKRAAQACRGKVGLVFQYPEYPLFAATVREDVAANSWYSGYWNTSPTLPRQACAARLSARSCPSSSTRPRVGCTRPFMCWMRVLLPLPVCPAMPRNSPSSSANVMSRSAQTASGSAPQAGFPCSREGGPSIAPASRRRFTRDFRFSWRAGSAYE